MSGSTTLTPNALESLLRDLDREAFVAFVADLWSHGGWETERDGSVLTVSRDGETDRVLVWTDERNRVERLLGVDPEDPDAGTIDTVVARRRDDAGALTIAEPYGARVIDASGLYDRLLYAIDRGDARDLCWAYFGGGVEPRPPREPDREGRAIEDVVGPRTFLAAAVLLALVVAVGVGLSGGPGDDAPPAPGTPEAESPGTPLITPVGAGEVTATETLESGMDPSRVPRDLRPTAERFERLRANASGYRNASFSCTGTPGELVETAVGAIRFNDPERDDGLRTVRRLAVTDNLSFEAFEEGITSPIYRPLFAFDRIAFESPSGAGAERTPSTGSTTRRAVVVARNGSIASYEFRLRYLARGCWKVDQVFRTPIDVTDEDVFGTPTDAPEARSRP